MLKGTILDALGKVTVKITMNDRTYTPRVRNGSFAQKLIFTKANQYAITVIAADEANNISTVSRNVIYRPTEHDDHERDSYKDASDERDSYEDDLNEHEDD